jgi:putative intracellular protease/amidase
MGSSGKSTGYELTELSRAYYVFQANGFEVDVASPQGGTPPVVIDGDDMKSYDYAFLNDSIAQAKVKQSITMKDVDAAAYDAVYFAGGKGAMFDFPENEHIQSLVREYFETGKVVAAVCHGPAALVNVTLSNGRPLLANRNVSGFTNKEELLLIPEAADIFPFLLQDKLTENGAHFNEGAMYLNTVSKDGNLVTGQNPWSTWAVAESVIEQMGYTPKKRIITTEENSISILGVFEAEGYNKAKATIDTFCAQDTMSIDRELIAVHSIVAAMQFDLLKATNLIRLLSYSNKYL